MGRIKYSEMIKNKTLVECRVLGCREEDKLCDDCGKCEEHCNEKWV